MSTRYLIGGVIILFILVSAILAPKERPAATAPRTESPAEAASYKAGYEAGWAHGKSAAWQGRELDRTRAMDLGERFAQGQAEPKRYATGYYFGYAEGWRAAKAVGAR